MNGWLSAHLKRGIADAPATQEREAGWDSRVTGNCPNVEAEDGWEWLQRQERSDGEGDYEDD